MAARCPCSSSRATSTRGRWAAIPSAADADLLAKPFTPDQLGQRVRQALDRSQARGEGVGAGECGGAAEPGRLVLSARGRPEAVSSGLEAVADAPHGADPAGVIGVDLDLAADAADVLGHGAGVLPVRGGAPHLGQQLLTGEDLAGRAGQEGQEVELLGRGLDQARPTA